STSRPPPRARLSPYTTLFRSPSAVIRPRPVLHRLRLQERVHRILGRQFRREPPYAPLQDEDGFPFSGLVNGSNRRPKSRADHDYIEIKGHDSSSTSCSAR